VGIQRRSLALAAVSAAAVGVLALAAGLAPASVTASGPGWLTDVNAMQMRSANPADGVEPLFGGRVNALAVDPVDPQVVYAASEAGGVFVSGDGGASWRHVDEIAMAATNDVKFMPGQPNVIVATGDYDGRVHSLGGVWVSRDGGSTWNPVDAGATCTAFPSARRIAFGQAAGGPVTIYVADDCGVAASSDLGASWTHLRPDGQAARYYDVVATTVGGQVQLDTCGDDGYFRSPDGGQTWTPPDGNSPNLASPNPGLCRLAVSPSDPNTVYLVNQFSGVLFETSSTTVLRTWAGVGANGGMQPRGDFVQTHPATDGNPAHFEVYYSSGFQVWHQTCSTTQTPRCHPYGAWDWFDQSISTYHFIGSANSDPGELAFDPTRPNGCPVIEAGDPGIAITNDGCDPQPLFRPSNVGLDALWLFGSPTGFLESTFAGSVFPDHTDLYAGTQDEGLLGSRDGGATWFSAAHQGRFAFGDDTEVIADHTGPNVLYTTNSPPVADWLLWGSSDEVRTSFAPPFQDLAHPVLAHQPPDACEPVFDPANCKPAYTQIGPGAYAFIGGANGDWISDLSSDLIVTTDGGHSYTRVGPVPLPGGLAYVPQASGPVSAPTIYYLGIDPNTNATSLCRVSGPFDPSATATCALGLQTPLVYAVSPVDPNFLYVSDIGAREMLFSHDGGASWTVDHTLTDLITHHGQFQFTAPFAEPEPCGTPCVNTFPYGQVTSIGFDPTGQTIMVGTWTAGIFASFDAGAHWREIPGSEQIPRADGFFFNERTGAIYVGSTGRGVWRIDVPGRETGTQPNITGFTPTNGPIGTQVTITGHNLDQVTEIAFNGVPTAASHNPDGSLTATVPTGNQETGGRATCR
jgi:photosystem II stability/assembly factor-like uncharacterized protein